MLKGEPDVLLEGGDAPSAAIVPQVKNTLMSTFAVDAVDVDPTKKPSSTKPNLAPEKTTLPNPPSALKASDTALGGVSSSVLPATTQTSMDTTVSIKGVND